MIDSDLSQHRFYSRTLSNIVCPRAMSVVLLFVIVTTVQAAYAASQVLITNAQIYTLDPNMPWAQAMLIQDEKIVFVGSPEQAAELAEANAERWDMQGAFLMPGFHDAHIHPMEGVSLGSFMGCDLIPLMEANPDPESWVEPLRDCKDIDFPHDWILGGGHDNSDLMALERMPKTLLDEAFPDTPAAFMEKSSHSMWVNSAALERLGIDRTTPHPQGGKIFRDPATGEPIGILSDSAGDELMHAALAKNPRLQAARYQAIKDSQDLMVSFGITSAVNARVYWQRGNLEPWLKAEREGALKLRNVMSLWAYPHMDDSYQLEQLASMYHEDPDSLLRITQVKFYSDGVPDLNSAAVHEPYGYLIHPDAEPLGGNYFTEARMAKYITALAPLGFGAMIHAIGDRGVHESLNAIEAAQRANDDLGVNKNRHYITHVNWVRADDYERFKALNIPADTQMNYIEYEDYEGGAFNYYDELATGEDDEWASLLINNTSETMAMPNIVSTGARFVLSSDWDVANIDPLFSIQNATVELKGATRNGELLSESALLELAIKAYTLNAAYAMNQETRTGSLEAGKFADFIVLDRNLFDIPVDTVREASVLETYVGGRRVYTAP